MKNYFQENYNTKVGNELSLSFREIKIPMYLVPLRPSENTVLVTSNRIDRVFSKSKSNKKIISIQLFDVTIYMELSENSNEYKYRY